jgi:hypothetical protein
MPRSCSSRTRRPLTRGLICGEVASSWVAIPLMRGFRHPLIHPAVPARPAGAGVAADAVRRAAAGIVASYPVCGFGAWIGAVGLGWAAG